MQSSFARHYLIASDFDQTLSFNDSGQELARLMGVHGFEEKVEGLARSHLVQQGGELAYLLRHDPAFRRVRREHLVEAGRRVRLKPAIASMVGLLEQGVGSNRFSFCVISAAPRALVVSALEGIVAADHIFGTEFDYDGASGEISAIRRVPAGYGKVAVLNEIQERLGIVTDRIVYIGDGSSDVHVMLHVNHGDGFTIAVSENRQVARIARATVLSDNALSALVPMLHQVLGLRTSEIRGLLEAQGVTLKDWERSRTERLTLLPAFGT